MPKPSGPVAASPLSPSEFGYSSEVSGLDTERILRTLAEHQVEYVLIGGLAAVAHGSTMSTADADVLPQLDGANLARLLQALRSLDAKVLVDDRRAAMESGEPWEMAELRRGEAGLRAAEAWHFTTSAGPIDVVITAAGVGAYEAHLGAADGLEVFGVEVRVAGIGDLIRSKETLDRPKDQAMLRELRDLQTDR